MNYSDFQNQVSSEKITLAILHASKRLMAWSLHSGSVYKLTNFDVSSIVSIEDSGNSYTEVASLASVTASTYFNDRDNQTLYIRTTGSDNPNGRFLVLTFKLFFANAPVTLASDLASGPEVYWEPMIKSSSSFGVEIDTINQMSEAIEGSGTLTLVNDNSFWPKYFDKLTFENKTCEIYSYNRELAASEAKLLFRGFVENKSYNSDQLQFKLKDLISVFKSPVALADIQDLGERTTDNNALAKQRMVLGRVFGHRPTNLDEVLKGYPVTGTVSISSADVNVTGAGTQFLKQLSPDDTLLLGGEEYTVASVTSDTSLTLSEPYSGALSLSGVTVVVKPEQPKRYINRKWLVAGHALREPTTTVQAGSSITRIPLASTKDMYDGDYVYIGEFGSGQLAKIQSVVSSKLVVLSTSLATIPPVGTKFYKPAVQNVRLDDVLLQFGSDYTFDAATARLTLSENAEANSAPLKKMATNLSFTNGSRIVTGTDISNFVKPGSLVGAYGQAVMFEVLSVDSGTQLTLRTNSTYTVTAAGIYKTYVFDGEKSVLTCDVLGRTDDGTSTGALLDSAPKVVKALLTDLGLSSAIDTDSFTAAENTAYQTIGMVIPTKVSDNTVPTYRDVFNTINPSVFGSIVQTQAFYLSYKVLQPNKSTAALRLAEEDILDITTTSAADKLVKTSIVKYRQLEYDYLAKASSISTSQKTSDTATYLIKTDRTRTFDTVLVSEVDALRHAKRWAMILENSAASLKVRTKLQAAGLEVGSIVDITHRKLYERFASSNKRKLAMVESVKKSGNQVDIVLVDLSNMFNRIGAYTNLTTDWANTDDEGRLYGGFFTDEYGLINNDAESFGSNLLW